MPLTPDPPFPKSQGDTLRSKDWNDATNEIIRLDTAKVNRSGDAITGSLTVDGQLGIGTRTPTAPLTIQSTAGAFVSTKGVNGSVELQVGADSTGAVVSAMSNHDLRLLAGGNNLKAVVRTDGVLQVLASAAVGPFVLPAVPGRLMVTGSVAEIGFARRNLASWPATPIQGDRYVWYNPDGTARLWTEGHGDLLTIDSAANVSLMGTLTIPKTAGVATFTNVAFLNEGQFRPNNLKLSLAATGFIIGGGLQYEFAIGHTFTSIIIGGGGGTSFVKRFSINENGDLFCSGSKTGYIVDYFLNAVGDTVEQGDVIVISEAEEIHYYGTNHDIPIPEIALTDRPYDPRVCGIVAQFVTEADLPTVDWIPQTEEEAANPPEHPLLGFVAEQDPGADRRRVAARQLGRMATLGAFAHCKVDADIAPVMAGDLLTTSPTRGHAQKVLEPEKALGAVIGKALASLSRGKGKVPVLVMLQ